MDEDERASASVKAALFLRNVAFIARNTRLLTATKPSAAIRGEYGAVMEQVADLKAHLGRKLRYPSNYDIRGSAGLLIYDIVRERKPKVAVETGVGNGLSARLILEAMERNGKGNLYSTEVSRKVGELIAGRCAKRWRLSVGPRGTVLSRTMTRLGKIDLFLHDSDHSYSNMVFELNAVQGRLAPGAVVMSDDVSANDAFMEFAQKLDAQPRIIPDIRRCFGYLEL